MNENRKSFPFKVLEGGHEDEKNLEKNVLKALAFMLAFEQEAKKNQDKSKRLSTLSFELQNLLLEIKTEIKKVKILKSFDEVNIEEGKRELENERKSEAQPPTSAQDLSLQLEFSASKYKKLAELVGLFNVSKKEFSEANTEWDSRERQEQK